jgi:hypothetical protein
MTWLDHVLAIPTVGCELSPSFQTSHEYISALRPLLKKWSDDVDAAEELRVSTPKPMELTIERRPGFNYSIEPGSMAVAFRYAYAAKRKPGQILPEFSGVLEVQKFSSLLEDAIERYCEAFDHIVGSETRGLMRIGIVAQCSLDGEGLPPGVSLFEKHLGRPWGGSLAKCQAHLLGTIFQDEKITDRCHHQIDVSDDRKNDVKLVLDWQRLFLTAPNIPKGKLLRDHFKKCSSAALEYFETFGKGDLNYGDLD